MSDWVTAKLKEVAKVVTGKTPQTSNSEYYGGDIPFVSPADLNEGILSETKTYLTSSGADQVYRVPENTVLVSCIGNLGKLAITSKEVCFNQQINGLIFDEQKIFPKYGFYFAQTLKPQLEKASSSTTLPIVNKSRFSDLEIKYPPLEEQRRIASILDQADELRQKRQQAIAKLDQLLQATFIDMFGDPVSNPKGWEKVKFEDEVEFLTGFAFKSADFKDSGIKLCRGINVLPNTLDWNDTAYWNEKELEKYSRFKILQNDILVAMDRPWISTGFKITLVKENDPNMLLVQRVARLRVKESFGANFVFQILSMPEFKKHCRITETTVPHISPTDFKSFDLIKPDNHMIEKFEKIAKLINIQKDKMRDSEVQNDNLFASLQTQAFNGTL